MGLAGSVEPAWASSSAILLSHSSTGRAWDHPHLLPSIEPHTSPARWNTHKPHGTGGFAVDDVSANWSGIVDSGTTFTGVTAEWNVPAVQASQATEVSATWVGLDGTSSTDTSIIQTGTTQATSGGATDYFAWYELYPSPSVVIGGVSPGDLMYAAISQYAPDVWTLTIEDLTLNATFSQNFDYYGPGESAEWIEEAPANASGQIATLADFGSVAFDNVAITAANQAGTTLTGVEMENAYGQTIAYASSFNYSTNSFTVTYGSPANPVSNPGPYTPVSPTRICDTRPGNPSALSGVATQCNGPDNDGTTISGGGTILIDVGGDFGVPSDASAVVLNVTVVAQDPGFLTVYPAYQVAPTASNLNYTRGEVVPNLVETGISTSGQVSIYSYATADVIVDLEGYVAASSGLGSGGGLYNPLAAPGRICDTRSGNPSGLTGTDAQCNSETMAAGSTLDVQVTGVGNVPFSGVAAVVLNVTVVNPVGPGYLTVWPEDVSPRPTASNLNFQAGQVVPNRVIVPVSNSSPNLGQISIYTTTQVDVLVDVSGWYSASGGTSGYQFTPESAPVRICDTRSGNPSYLTGAYAQCNGETLGPGGSLAVTAAGLASVPSGAKAVVLNVTAVLPSNFTYVTVYAQAPVPVVSDLNPYPGEVEPNLVVATLSTTGSFNLYNAAGSTDIVVDVLGWYS